MKVRQKFAQENFLRSTLRCPLTHLDKWDSAIRIAEGLYYSLWRYKVGYTVCGGGLCLCLLIFKSIQKILPPMLFITVLHYGP
jgi:hypothetical protein